MDDVTDQEQADKVRAFWHSTGKYLLVAVAFGLLLSFGWRYWQKQQLLHAQQASTLYESVLVHKASSASVNQVALDKLMNSHARSVYAVMAQLDVAGVALQEKNDSKAIAAYQWVIVNAKESGYRFLASIRLARVFLGKHQPDQALPVLAKIPVGPFGGMKTMLEAQAYEQQGKIALAKKTRAQAKQSLNGLSVPTWMNA